MFFLKNTGFGLSCIYIFPSFHIFSRFLYFCFLLSGWKWKKNWKGKLLSVCASALLNRRGFASSKTKCLIFFWFVGRQGIGKENNRKEFWTDFWDCPETERFFLSRSCLLSLSWSSLCEQFIGCGFYQTLWLILALMHTETTSRFHCNMQWKRKAVYLPRRYWASFWFNQLLLIQPTTNAKWSLNRRDNNPSKDTRRCW